MGLFGGISNALFGNSGKDAARSIGKLAPMYQQQYQPYMDYGMRAMQPLEEQYKMLLNNPQALMQMLGSGFREDPGYKFNMDQAMNASNNAAAAGGLLGTPAHQQQSMGYASGLADQQYNDYFARMLGLYGTGLEGTQNQFNTGYNAMQGYTGNMGQLGQNQAQFRYTGQQNNNQMLGGLLGSLMGGFGGGR
jgi:hypothetical protein